MMSATKTRINIQLSRNQILNIQNKILAMLRQDVLGDGKLEDDEESVNAKAAD